MRPASVGVAPRAICMYWLRNTDAPNIAMPVAIEAITARVKVRLRNIESGMSGSLDAQLDDDEHDRGRAARRRP